MKSNLLQPSLGFSTRIALFTNCIPASAVEHIHTGHKVVFAHIKPLKNVQQWRLAISLSSMNQKQTICAEKLCLGSPLSRKTTCTAKSAQEIPYTTAFSNSSYAKYSEKVPLYCGKKSSSIFLPYLETKHGSKSVNRRTEKNTDQSTTNE